MLRPPVGMLVVRAWVEVGSTEPLQAAIRLTADAHLGFTPGVSVSDTSARYRSRPSVLDGVLGET